MMPIQAPPLSATRTWESLAKLCLVAVSCLSGVTLSGCERYARQPPAAASGAAEDSPTDPPGDHSAGDRHRLADGSEGGLITSVGANAFHIETILDQRASLSMYVLGTDAARLHPVPQQRATMYVKPQAGGPATAVLLESDPLEGDPAGMTTRLSAVLPEDLPATAWYIVVPGLEIAGQRYLVRVSMPRRPEATMPTPVADQRAAQLYLTPGGLYTEGDIAANGRQTAHQKYRAFQPQHDPHPAAGDRVCPITQTKASLQCGWIIGGQTYFFCCPPCIDEFLQLAKTDPDVILAADAYRR